MKTAYKNIGAATALVIVGFASFWLGKSRVPDGAIVPKAVALAPPTIVEIARVNSAPIAQSITAVGSLRSDETVIVRPEVSGRIAEIGFKEGQRVVKGTILLKLDASVQQAELQQADANLALAKSRIERARDLHAKGFISSQARDEAESNFKVAQASYELAAAKLTKLEIKAPFSGVAGLRLVSVGDYVREGQDIVNIEELDPLKVDFRVPEIFLKRVSNGQSLQVSLDSFPDKIFAGRVLAINPLIDANGRSIVIRATVANTDTRLRPGMFARVRLITNDKQEGLTIPEQALIPVGDDVYVYRVVDGLAQRTKIEIGQRGAGVVEVTRGLANTDSVVTAGQIKIRDGAAVKVADMPDVKPGATSPSPAPAAAASEKTDPAKKS